MHNVIFAIRVSIKKTKKQNKTHAECCVGRAGQGERALGVVCLVFMFCNVDWSWRGYVLSFVDVKLQRGKGEKKKENWSLM